ncbi:TonB-dependent receptor [Mucilaginibacter mallensis]|nr:TonB-dependent receptor [Mucilaginibacter mallensis]
MKLTLIIFLSLTLSSYANVLAQKVNLNENNASLKTIFRKIKKQTNYTFVYTESELNKTDKISVHIENASVEDALKACFEKLPLSYAILNNMVIVKDKQETPKASNDQQQAPINIHGTVTDTAGLALPGVNVSIKGTPRGVVTDLKGEYTIKADANAILVFSFVGYKPVEIPVQNRLDINVILKQGTASLSEVIVVAYGTTTKRAINSAVSTLAMGNVAPLPVQSINDAVAGRIPGVIVTTTDGAPGTKSQISIRGNGTPLFVIDGVIRFQSDFENLNPNDIENYSVLKDAAATSLYGPLGGNGVIVVTTKRGKAGELNINYSYNAILSQPTVLPQKLSSYDHLNAVNQLYRSEGLQPPTPDSILNYYKTQSKPFLYPNTNWQEIALKTWALEQRHDFSISSGTKELTYYASLSNYDQGSILKTDHNYNDRTTYRLNTVSSFDKIHLKVTTSIDGYVETNEVPNSSTANSYDAIFSHIENASPTLLAYNQLGLPSVNSAAGSPALELSPLAGYSKGTNRVFNSILGFDYAAPFLEGLHFKVTGNYNMENSQSKAWDVSAPAYADNSSTPIYGNPPTLTAGAAESTTLILQGFVTYNKTFGDNHIDFTGGYEQTQDKSTNIYATRQQYQILLDQFVAGPTVNQLAGGSEAEDGRAGYIGRLGYNYKSKYFLEGTLRYDGSDLFPPGKQWGTFYALSGGWILSDEKFMQSLKAKHILDFFKLRGSYGLTGIENGISRFEYVSGYSVDANAWVVAGQPVQGTSEPGTLPSTNFSWYSIRSRNMGLDFASLNNRLSGSIDYFYSRTTGFVQSNPIYSATLGIGLPPTNSPGALRREGAEFNLTWNSRVDQFTYKVGLNFTYANQLWELNPGENFVSLENPYTRISGSSLYTLTQGYHAIGFYTNNSQLLSGPIRPSSINLMPGDLQYQDTNGDGKIDASDFRNIGASTFPTINFGTTIDLGYKGISFSAVIMGSGNRDRYIGDAVQGSGTQGILIYGFQENYWTPANPNALYPRAVSNSGVNGGNNVATSDFWILKSRYVRLKYLQLGYDLKRSLVKNTAFKELRVFVSGTNLLTSSNSLKYFIDPESDSNNYGYPIQRTIALGVKASF